jgi:Tfp pilus assembly protein PilZ
LQKIRCQYQDAAAFEEAIGENSTLTVFTTDAFEPGEEVLLEVSYGGLPGKIMVRGIGREWHAARPRLRVRAGGSVACAGTEWRKIEFLQQVAKGEIKLLARRRHVRLPVLVEVQWRQNGDRTRQTAALSELSEGGALLLTNNGLSVGTEIIIEITPPGAALALEILAVVRNASNEEGLGLEFVARDMGGVHRLREVIRRIVEQ